MDNKDSTVSPRSLRTYLSWDEGLTIDFCCRFNLEHIIFLFDEWLESYFEWNFASFDSFFMAATGRFWLWVWRMWLTMFNMWVQSVGSLLCLPPSVLPLTCVLYKSSVCHFHGTNGSWGLISHTNCAWWPLNSCLKNRPLHFASLLSVNDLLGLWSRLCAQRQISLLWLAIENVGSSLIG